MIPHQSVFKRWCFLHHSILHFVNFIRLCTENSALKFESKFASDLYLWVSRFKGLTCVCNHWATCNDRIPWWHCIKDNILFSWLLGEEQKDTREDGGKGSYPKATWGTNKWVLKMMVYATCWQQSATYKYSRTFKASIQAQK